MRYDVPVYLSLPTVVLGERAESAAAAVAAGRLSQEAADLYGYRELTASDLAAVQLAERAAATALERARISPAEVDRLFHAWTYHQGHEFWSPAHYLANQLGADRAVPIGIQQMCNGGMAAIDAAAHELVADRETTLALVTTGDRFAEPGFDRWGDLGVAYGDGATAVLVSRTPLGPAVRLLSCVTVAASGLEGMHRGVEPFSPAPRSGSEQLRPARTKRQFAENQPAMDFGKTAVALVADLITSSLGQAGIAADDPRLIGVTLPRLAEHTLEKVYIPAVQAACPALALDLGRDTGHLGAGDSVANLAHLFSSGQQYPGKLLVLLGAGAGFTWSAAVVEML